MTQSEVISLMESSKNDSEWSTNCKKVKEAHGGGYPSYWFQEVIQSGLMDRTLGQGASEIKIVGLPNCS